MKNINVDKLLQTIGTAILLLATVFACYVGVLAFSRQEVREILVPFNPTRTPEIREIPVTVISEKQVTVVVERQITVLPPTYTPLPTYTPVPTNIPVATPDMSSTVIAAVEATLTALPTNVPIIEIATPTLEPTSIEPTNTPPGIILNSGETWRQEGAEILKEEGLSSEGGKNKGVYFKIYFTNQKISDVSFNYSLDNISAEDNLGRSLPLKYYIKSAGYNYSCGTSSKVVARGKTVLLSCSNQYILARVDIGDPAITGVVITVTGISSITDARWRIPVFH